VSKKALATLLLSVACGCAPAVARAAETAKLDAAFLPYKLGQPTTVDIHVRIANSDGGVPGPVTSFTTHLPPALEVIGSSLGLAVCQAQDLLAEGLSGCSPNARMGLGSAVVEVPFGPEIVSETASVVALMGPPAGPEGEDVGVLLYAEGQTPVQAQAVLPGVVIVGAGPIGESISTNVPLTPTLPGAADASMTSMHISFGPKHLTYYKKVHGKTVGYQPRGVSLPSICPRGGFRFMTELTFQDGTYLKVPSNVPCPSSRHH
jgi:hypothetical protein